jgi:hypothetical protein
MYYETNRVPVKRKAKREMKKTEQGTMQTANRVLQSGNMKNDAKPRGAGGSVQTLAHINIKIPRAILTWVDRRATRQKITRSAVLRDVLFQAYRGRSK